MESTNPFSALVLSVQYAGFPLQVEEGSYEVQQALEQTLSGTQKKFLLEWNAAYEKYISMDTEDRDMPVNMKAMRLLDDQGVQLALSLSSQLGPGVKIKYYSERDYKFIALCDGGKSQKMH